MKIKDIVTEGILDYLAKHSGMSDHVALSAVANKGYKEFTKLLRDNNININQPTPEIADKLPDYLTQWTVNYMSGGDSRKEQPKIIAKIQAIPVPSTINLITIRQYLSDAAKARQQAKEEVKNSLPTSPSSQSVQPTPAPAQQTAANLQTAPAQPVSVGGVTLNRTAGRNNAGQPTPTLVTYKNQQYNLMDDGRWLTVFGKPVNTATASFLQTELESIS
jgi:hypothetical protein